MPAIGLAAAVLAQRDPEALLGSFAADHVIRDGAAFDAAVREAVAVARAGWLVTIGITPTYPATGFGYVELGEPLGLDRGAVRRAGRQQFVEKPDPATAESYCGTADSVGTQGMFVVRAETLLELLRLEHPALEDVAARDRAGLGRSRPGCDAGAAVAGHRGRSRSTTPSPSRPPQPAGSRACRPISAGTTSGTGPRWPACSRRPEAGGRGSSATPDGCSRSTAPASSYRPVVARSSSIGLDDVVVVDTPDAVLVLPADQAQRVKDVVAQLRAAGRTDLL